MMPRLSWSAWLALLAPWAFLPPALAADAMPGMGQKAARQELGASAAFAPDGSLLVAAKQGEHVLLYKSRDEGRNWLPPVVVNAQPEAISADGENRPKIAFAKDGAVLVAWTKPLSKPYSGEIRLARADDGERFKPPITVHRDRSEITHRFESIAVGQDGQVLIAWIDKRDLEAAGGKQGNYRGAAIYAALSADGGRSFAVEQKIADHSCECCRIAIAHEKDGAPLLLWRHVFAPNERDHALARLNPDGAPAFVQRATFEGWRVDACPHHGPSLAVDGEGTRHAVWFNVKAGEGRVFYGRLVSAGNAVTVEGQRPVGGPRAAHADLATAGKRLAIAWTEFDGERTRLHALLSADAGQTFVQRELADTAGASDQARVIARGERLFAFWRTADEGFRLMPLP